MFPLLIDVVDVTGHFLEVAGGLVDQSIESGLLWTTQRGGGGGKFMKCLVASWCTKI